MIYDPDWRPTHASDLQEGSKSIRFTQLSSLARARVFYQEITRGKKFKIGEIRVGGGGNKSKRCGMMCQELLVKLYTGKEDEAMVWAEKKSELVGK